MGKNRRIQQFALVVSMVAGAWIADAQRARACTCLPPTVESSYQNSTDVVQARVLFGLFVGSQVWYLAEVQRTFKGCLSPNERVLLTTPNSSAACGVTLSAGNSYLLNGDDSGTFFGTARLAITLCDYNPLWNTLSDHDRDFLAGRTVCCGTDCTCADGSDPVACLVDPCQVAPECPDGECVANYCGGCNAEFYDANGYAVCDSACQQDEDCPEDRWCRASSPASNPEDSVGASAGVPTAGMECVPFVGEGETCNGFTLPWFYERCEPWLSCDLIDLIPDAPGRCRLPCEDNDDCQKPAYCASDKLCDSDGGCEHDVDCNLPGNDYIHIECVGHGVCDSASQQCGWKCGDPQCVDVTGYDFGPCDAVLGWAVVGEQCAEVSGCDSGPLNLFDSELECNSACIDTCADPECAPTCENLAGHDFGPCEAVLGWAVVGDECRQVSGCSAAPLVLHPSADSCKRRCFDTRACEDPAGDVVEREAIPGEGVAADRCECASDTDCLVTGCSAHVCAPQQVITTCEFLPEYACYQDEDITTCGCHAGRCGWDPTPQLAQCIESAGTGVVPIELQ